MDLPELSGLLSFDGFEKSFEVSSTKTIVVTSLDDLHEEGRSIFKRQSKELKEVTLVVVVDQDLQLLDSVNIFGDLGASLGESLAEVVVVSVGDLLKELDTSSHHALDSLDYVLGSHGDVLDTGTTVEFTELGNLRFLQTVCGLVNRHLNFLIKISHDNGAEGRVFGVDLLVIHGPEPVEVEHLLVPLSNGLHLAIGLVSDAMVDSLKIGDGEHLVEALVKGRFLVSGEEDTVVVNTLNEGVDSISVGLD